MHIQLYDEATLLVIFISQSVSQSVGQPIFGKNNEF
jgi:hypothetical protein